MKKFPVNCFTENFAKKLALGIGTIAVLLREITLTIGEGRVIFVNDLPVK